MRIDLVQTDTEFFLLRKAWDALIERANDVSIFMSWAWQYYWWKHYGKDQKLRLVIARDGNRIVGILPLYVRTAKLFRSVPVKILQFVGTGGDTSPEYLGPIIDSNTPLNVIDEIVDYALDSMQGWDGLYLNEISADSRFHKALIKHCSKRGLPYNADILSFNAYVSLPDKWEKFLSSLSSKRRYKIRRMRRGFEELAESRFFVWYDESQLQKAIERLIALHHMRWSGTDEYSFSSPEYIAFHTDLMHALMKNGNLRLYCLEAEGKIIAIDYCYAWNSEIMGFQRGFDPAYEKYSPGGVLLGYQIEHAIGECCKGFDFLKGDHDYKRYVANNARKKVAIRSYRCCAAGTVYRMRTEHIPKLKRQVLAKLSAFGRTSFRNAIRA